MLTAPRKWWIWSLPAYMGRWAESITFLKAQTEKKRWVMWRMPRHTQCVVVWNYSLFFLNATMRIAYSRKEKKRKEKVNMKGVEGTSIPIHLMMKKLRSYMMETEHAWQIFTTPGKELIISPWLRCRSGRMDAESFWILSGSFRTLTYPSSLPRQTSILKTISNSAISVLLHLALNIGWRIHQWEFHSHCAEHTVHAQC